MKELIFEIGDVVALASHHFIKKNVKIGYSGDPLQQSPLMVIAEILPAWIDKDEKEHQTQFKGSWFSYKTQGFETAWFRFEQLKLIERPKDRSDELPTIGSILSFNSLNFELGKIKCSVNYDLNFGEEEKVLNNTNPLLSFVSPVLVVTGHREEIPKENSRIRSTIQQIKVQWFNQPEGKFSEVFLPVTSLRQIPTINEDLIMKVQSAVDNGKFLKIYLKQFVTLVKPKRLVFLSGQYSIQGYDLIKGSFVEFDLNSIKKIKPIKTAVKLTGPEFDFSKSDKPTLRIGEVISNAEFNKRVIRIVYKNYHDEVTTRCVKDFVGHKKNRVDKYIAYISGSCLSRSSERNFKIERISKVEILDLKWDEAN